MTCSEKRDLRDIFMNIEILAWIDSPVYTEYKWCKLQGKILITSGVITICIHSGRYSRFLKIDVF